MVGLDGTCSWCQRDVRFQRVWSLPWTRPGVTEVHEVVSCPREECAGATYRTGQGVSTPQGWQLDTLTAQWPPLGSTPPHQSLPKPVAEDWVEAHKCVGITAYKAAAAMARRATQGVSIDKKPKPGKLANQLNALVHA